MTVELSRMGYPAHEILKHKTAFGIYTQIQSGDRLRKKTLLQE